jgi:predicted permease
MVESLLRDLAYAWRSVGRSPGFFAVAVLSLGLGVGVNTAMFSLVDAVLLRPLPVTAPETLVDVFSTGADPAEYATTSYPDFLDLQAANTVFSEMTGYSPMLAPLSLGDRSRIVFGQVVTGNHFSMFGVRPALGRLLVPSDDAPGAARVVVLSHRMWQREFGGDPGVVGRILTMRGLDYTVAGVADASFTGVVPLLTPDLWMPIAHVEEVEPAGITNAVPSPTGRTRLERRGTRWMFVKGRLRPGVSAAAAHANVALIGQQLAAAHPATNRVTRLAAVPSSDVRLLVPQAGGPLAAGASGLMGIVGLVLLIACANVAGMLLARASARGREIGVRLAIGASRARLVQQLLVEGALVGVLGAAVALGCAWMMVRALVAVDLPLPVDVALDLRLDGRVLAFALAAAVATGVLASLLPALKASRWNVVSDLRGDLPAARVRGRRWTARDALVVTQIAATAVLLVVAGLLLRSLAASRDAAVGFEPHGLAAVAFDTDMMRYEPDRGLQFWRDTLARVRALPGVRSAGLVSPTLPFTVNFNNGEFQIDTRQYADPDEGDEVENVAVSPGYLDTLGLRVVDGRGIDATDVAGAPLSVVVNETMARRFWPGQSAVGHTITAAASKRVFRVVGVVTDSKQHGVLETPAPFAYFAGAQQPSRFNYLVARTDGDARALVELLQRDVRAMAPDVVFMDALTMEQAMAGTLVPARIGALLAAGFGILGTLLAAIGLYGVVAFSVARRTREIGVRMALGAEPSGVVGLVMGQGFTLVAAGLAAGLSLAAGAAFGLRGLLYGIGPLDPLAWGGAIVAMVAAAAAANFVPARRAMRIAPVTALRSE